MAEKEEYASKGVAGSGLGLGIAGTALALLNNGGDGLAGLLGGGNKMSVLQAENAQLKAQGYTDAATRGLAIEQARQAEQIACIQARFGTERQITDAAIANAVLETSVATTKLAGALECLQNTVAGISSTYQVAIDPSMGGRHRTVAPVWPNIREAWGPHVATAVRQKLPRAGIFGAGLPEHLLRNGFRWSHPLFGAETPAFMPGRKRPSVLRTCCVFSKFVIDFASHATSSQPSQASSMQRLPKQLWRKVSGLKDALCRTPFLVRFVVGLPTLT